jgi:hypothetical protein
MGGEWWPRRICTKKFASALALVGYFWASGDHGAHLHQEGVKGRVCRFLFMFTYADSPLTLSREKVTNRFLHSFFWRQTSESLYHSIPFRCPNASIFSPEVLSHTGETTV